MKLIDLLNYKVLLHIVMVLVTIQLILTSIISPVLGQRDAFIVELEVRADPPIQGVGGNITIIGSITFAAPCSSMSEAYDVNATIVLEEGLKLNQGHQTQMLGNVTHITCYPGKDQIVNSIWVVSATEPGDYTLKFLARSRNAGHGEKQYTVKFISGPSISTVIIPEEPTIDDQIEIGVILGKVHVDDIIRVLLNYRKDGEDWGSIETEHSGDSYWATIIPKQEEGIFNFFFEIETLDGKTTEYSVYELKVRDVVRISQWKDTMVVSYFGLIVVGIVVITTVGRWMRRERKDRISNVPSTLRPEQSLYYETTEPSGREKFKLDIKRKHFILLLVIFAALLLIAIFSNQFVQLMPYLKQVPP